MRDNSSVKNILLFTLSFLISHSCFAVRNFTIFAKDGLPPITFLDQGNLNGLAIDVVNEIQRRLGTNDPLRPVPWARGNQMIQTRPKTVLLTLAPDDDRKKNIYYLGPIAATETAMFAKNDFKGEITNLDSIAREKIAVRFGTHSERMLLKKHFTRLETTASIKQNIQMVHGGRVKFICDTTMEIDGAVKLYNLMPLKKIFVITKTNLYIAFSKDISEDLLNKWRKALQEMKDDGTFLKIYRKWLSEGTPPMNVELLIS